VLSIKVIGALIGTLPAKKLKSYFIFATPVMKIVHDFLFENQDEDSLVESLSTFAEIIETEPKFFKKDVDSFFELLVKIRNVKDVDHGIKDQCVEIVTSFCQRFPETLKSNQERLKKIVEMIFTHMMEIDDEVDEEWKNPPDGFDEELAETDDQQIVQFSVDCIDRLISHVGKDTMLPFLSDCIKTLLTSDNWKMKHSAFMAISQLGEYISEIDEIAPIIITIGKFIDNENPRVRYACCHAIGQLSDDMSPDFQVKYLHDVMPMIGRRLGDDVPRVVGHACAALTNILEPCDQPVEQIQPYLAELYNKLWELIKGNTSTYVKENALSALSALSVGATGREKNRTIELFTEFYPDHIQNCLNIIENAKDSTYKKVVGHALECASISSRSVAQAVFEPYAERLITQMIAIQKNIVDDPDLEGDNPQLGFLLSSWERISRALGEFFNPYIDRMMPTLIVLCKNVITIGKKYEEDPNVDGEGEDKHAKFNTYDDDNCLVAINMIRIFLKKRAAALQNWIEPIYEVVVSLLTYLPNDSVRTIAGSCLPPIINCMEQTNNQDKIP
jgi:hypothetical protein